MKNNQLILGILGLLFSRRMRPDWAGNVERPAWLFVDEIVTNQK